MKTIAYDNPPMGCYLDQANYNNDELSKEICQIAFGYGWQDREADALCNDDNADSEALDWASNDAIEYLNGLETRPFMYWANEGEANAFGLWVNLEGAKEDVGFISSRKAEYPDADYEGDWLHVSDHGNCTLYVREAGKDREIWSIV